MKHTALKTALFSISATLLLILGTNMASAQYYYQMKVRTLDGLITPFDVSRIDSVYFELAGSADNGNDEDETTVTGNATDITPYTATITSWANILDNLSSDLKVGIIYTLEGTPNKTNGTQKTVSTSSLGSDAKYTITLTDLAPATTYYYRSFVYQSGIWFYGNVKEFTTKGQGVELVSGEVSKLTCYSSKVSGAISIDETTQYRTITYGICYSTNVEPTVNNSKVEANSKDKDGNFTCQLRALKGSTTYYYRSYAYVDSYLSYGPIRSFTTKDDDVVITGDIDTTNYSVKSTLKIGSGAYSTLILGVCYEIYETPTINDKTVTTNEVDDENNFALTLTSIPFGTVYYRSYVLIDNVAHYGKIKSFTRELPNLNGFEYVDLGLSVMWATCNVDAEKSSDLGNTYHWGDTIAARNSGWSYYKYCVIYSSSAKPYLKKYCTKSSDGYNGYTDDKTVLDPMDDVAHVKWGGDWRIPTPDEIKELQDNCVWEWTTQNNIEGFKVTSKKSGYKNCSIFLPKSFYGYWSNTLSQESSESAQYFQCTLDSYYKPVHKMGQTLRCNNLRVRPVCP